MKSYVFYLGEGGEENAWLYLNSLGFCHSVLVVAISDFLFSIDAGKYDEASNLFVRMQEAGIKPGQVCMRNQSQIQ